MGKKTLKLPSLFKTKESPPPLLRKHPWQLFPSFSQRRNLKSTLSSDDLVFPDPTDDDDENYRYGESLEMFVSRGVRSERLFFEPGGNTTSSILEKAKADHNGNGGFPLEENGVVLLAMESEDPCGDFRRSMEEMVESHGVKGWKGLEELLSWYLMVNDKNNHGFIVLAFVDLLISLAAAAAADHDDDDSCSHYSTSSYFSAVSSLASSSLCQSEGQNEIVDHHEDTARKVL